MIDTMVTSRSAPATQPRRTQAQRREETRDRLFRAALECLVEHGYAGMTLSAVVKRAGLSSGALWRHCQTKAELAYLAVSYAGEQDLANRVSNSTAPLPTITSISDLLLQPPTDLASRGAFELLRASAVDEDLRAHFAAGSWNQWLELSAWLERGLGGGALDERTASMVRVLSLASAALQVFFRDEQVATTLRRDIETLTRETIEHAQATQKSGRGSRR